MKSLLLIFLLIFCPYIYADLCELQNNNTYPINSAKLEKIKQDLEQKISQTSSPGLDKKIMSIYKKHFQDYDTINDMPWDCAGNSYDLYLELMKGNISQNRNYFIVYVFYAHPTQFTLNQKLIPKKPRQKTDWWSFHAFLVIDDIVFDQYFSKKPTAIDFNKYLKEMWGEENLERLRFQIVPAGQFSPIKNFGYIANDIEKYPILNHSQIAVILTNKSLKK